MQNKILIAYASTHGSTREVAEAITKVLSEKGLAVELQPARKVRTLDGYSLVVLGAALYMFHLHKDGLRFLSWHQKALANGVQVAIFAGGPIEKGDEEEWQGVRNQLDQELAKFPWLKPATVKVIGGRFDPTRLRFPWNLIPYLRQTPPNDLRDWDDIHSWAKELAIQLQPGSSNNEME